MSRIKFVFVLMMTLVVGAMGHDRGSRYDGRWWSSSSEEVRAAFLSGYYDCYIWDVRGTAYSDGSVMQEARKISEYYKSNPGATNAPVLQVVKTFNEGKKHATVQSKDRHGENDGDYWRQMSHPEREAFIGGYIACHSEYLHGGFSKSTDSYVNAISKWYGVSDQDVSELSPKTGEDKIANVLLRLRDKSTSAPTTKAAKK